MSRPRPICASGGTVQRTGAELPDRYRETRESIPADCGPANTGESGRARYRRQQSLPTAATAQRLSELREYPKAWRQVIDRYQSFASYQAGWDTGWELDFWGRFRRGIESADATYFASITSHQDVQVLLGAQVADLYFAYRTTLLRIGIARNKCGHPETQLRNHREDIRRRSRTRSWTAAGQDTISVHAGDDTGSRSDAGQHSQRACRAAGPTPGDVPELASVEGPLPAMEPLDIQGHSRPVCCCAGRISARPPGRSPRSRRRSASQKPTTIPAITLLGSIGWSCEFAGCQP